MIDLDAMNKDPWSMWPVDKMELRSLVDEIERLIRSMLEEAESLEQLRLLENGFRIQCIKTLIDNPGVNTAEDLELVRKIIRDASPC